MPVRVRCFDSPSTLQTCRCCEQCTCHTYVAGLRQVHKLLQGPEMLLLLLVATDEEHRPWPPEQNPFPLHGGFPGQYAGWEQFLPLRRKDAVINHYDV